MDTLAIPDRGNLVEGKGLEGSPGSIAATHARPRPHKVKERIYREAVKTRQKTTPQPLATWAVEITTLLRSRDAEARQQNARDIATFYQYYACNEYGEFNEAGQWQPDLNTDDDFMYSVPLTPAHVDAAKTLLLKTNIEYEYKAKNKISVMDKQVAAMCQELAEEDIERIFTDDLVIREKLYLLLAGKSYRHFYWARNPLEPEMVEIPVYSSEQVDGKSRRVCAKCGKSLEETDEICTKCMSDEIQTIEGGKINRMTSSNQAVTLAYNQMYVPNPLAVQDDLSKTNINSSFLIERDALPRGEAEFLYAQVLPTGRNALSEQVRIVRELERARLRTGNVRGDELTAALTSILGADDKDLIERERVWLARWQYANVLITEEHWYKTKQDGLVWCEDKADIPDNAEHVKPDSFLGDVYPNGCFLCVIDDNLVEINEASVADGWIKIILGMLPANADGAGLRRLRHLADMANDSTNLEFKVLMDDADPKTFLDKSYMSHLSKVGEWNLVDALKEGDTWEKIVHRLEGTASHPAVGMMTERVNGMAQFMVGTFSSVGAGAPDIKAAGTATGVVKMAEEAAGRYLEAILLLKVADIDSRYKVLRNRQKHSIDPQRKDIEKRFGKEVTNRFFSCRLRDVIGISAKKGTDQPQSQAIKIAQLEAYSNAASTVGQLPNGQQMLESFAEMIDLPVTVGVGMTDREEAERRIGLLQEAAAQYADKEIKPEEIIKIAMMMVSAMLAEAEREVPVENVAIQATPTGEQQLAAADPQAMPPGGQEGQGGEAPPAPVPTVIMMQEHPVFMDTCKDWLMTEGPKSNNKPLCASIFLLWKLHFAREVAKQQELMRIEATKQLMLEKMKMDFAAQNAPPPPPPEPGTSPEEIAAATKEQEEAAVAQGVLDRIADDESKEADLDREQRGKDADFEREQKGKDADLERDTMRTEHAAEVQKETQPKPGEAKK